MAWRHACSKYRSFSGNASSDFLPDIGRDGVRNINHLSLLLLPVADCYFSMGKTIQIIALFLSDSAKPNLVVAYVISSFSYSIIPDKPHCRPTVAIMQWRNEIEAHTDGLKVLVWHGGSRESDINQLKKFDVVLTTYAILER